MDPKQWQLPARRVLQQVPSVSSVTWDNAVASFQQKLFGHVSCITYNPAGTQLAATSTNQSLLVRVPESEGCIWNEQASRKLYTTRFRGDGKMTVSTVEKRVVVKSTETAFERQFLGHTRDVRDAVFVAMQQLVSASDDNTVRLWDVVAQTEIECSSEHKDYVRSLAFSGRGHIVASGSYDCSVMLWDMRQGLHSPIQTCLHSAAVEQVILIDSKSMCVTASGDVVSIFDWRNLGAGPMCSTSHHTKTVTALAYCPQHDALLSGSLDKRVKVLNLAQAASGSVEVVAQRKLENPVTSLAVHPHGTEMAVGTNAGELLVYTLREEGEEDAARIPPAIRRERACKAKLEAVAVQFRSFKYQRALRTALYSGFPDVILSTLEELQRRCALHVAVSGHNDRTIAQLLRFATDYIDNPRYADMMLAVVDVVCEIYAVVAKESPYFYRQLQHAQRKIAQSLSAVGMMAKSVGLMELICQASTLTPDAPVASS